MKRRFEEGPPVLSGGGASPASSALVVDDDRPRFAEDDGDAEEEAARRGAEMQEEQLVMSAWGKKYKAGHAPKSSHVGNLLPDDDLQKYTTLLPWNRGKPAGDGAGARCRVEAALRCREPVGRLDGGGASWRMDGRSLWSDVDFVRDAGGVVRTGFCAHGGKIRLIWWVNVVSMWPRLVDGWRVGLDWRCSWLECWYSLRTPKVIHSVQAICSVCVAGMLGYIGSQIVVHFGLNWALLGSHFKSNVQARLSVPNRST